MTNQGRRNKINGANFERKTKEHLTEQGWNVSKFQSNIDIPTRKLITAKSNRFLMRTTGFPDFICWKPNTDGGYNVIGVESKINGYLSKEEKQKIEILLELNVFSNIYVARKEKRDGRTSFPLYIDVRNNQWKLSL